MELEILHSTMGDKSKKFDTETEAGRTEAANCVKKLIRGGTAIFLERGGKTYRIKDFDVKRNKVIVRVERKGKNVDVAAKPGKGKQTAVPPRAGG